MNMAELQEWAMNEAPSYAYEVSVQAPDCPPDKIELMARTICEKLGRSEQVLVSALAFEIAEMLGFDDLADGWATVYINELRAIYEKETH